MIVSRKTKLSGEGNRCHASHRSLLSWAPFGDNGFKCSSHDSTIVVPEALRICLKTTARAQGVACSGMRAWLALPEGRGPISRASRESGLCATRERPGGLRRQPSAGAPRAVSEGFYTSNIHPTYIQHPIQHTSNIPSNMGPKTLFYKAPATFSGVRVGALWPPLH